MTEQVQFVWKGHQEKMFSAKKERKKKRPQKHVWAILMLFTFIVVGDITGVGVDWKNK